MARQQLLGGAALEGRLSGKHLVQNAAKGIEVAPAVQVSGTRGLLGAHVGGGTESEPGFRQPLIAGGGDGARYAEVRHDRLAALQEDVLGLDVPVNDSL